MESIDIEFLIKDSVSAGVEKIGANAEVLGGKAKKVSAEYSKALSAQRKQIEDLKIVVADLEKQLSKAPKSDFVGELSTQVSSANTEIQQLNAHLDKSEKEFAENEQKVGKLTRELNNMLNKLTIMRTEGKQNTKEYRELAQAAAELHDNLGDVRGEIKALADDNALTSGMVSGISGLAGAVSAGTGAMSLFVGENEDLAVIQTKLQSLMAITIGLQQVLNTLNKDSAFSVNVLSKAKVFLTGVNTKLATALGWTNTQAAILMGTLTLGASVLVGVAISAWQSYSKSVGAATERIKDNMLANKEANVEWYKTINELDRVKASIKNFNGSKAEEKIKVEQLNSKYSAAFGHYSTLAQWYDVLTKKSSIYAQALGLQAQAQAYANKAIKLNEEIIDIESSSPDDLQGAMDGVTETWTYITNWGKKGRDKVRAFNDQNKADLLMIKKQGRDVYNQQAAYFARKAEELMKTNKLADFAPKPEPIKNAADDLKRAVEDGLKSLAENVEQGAIDILADGSEKIIRQLQLDYQRQVNVIKDLYDKTRKAQGGKLTDEQQKVIDSAYDIAYKKLSKGLAEEKQKSKEQLNSLINTYKSYDQRRRDIEDKYNADIAEYKKNAANIDEETLKASMAERERVYKEDLKVLQDELLKVSSFYSDLFGDISDKGSKSLKHLLSEAKKILSTAVIGSDGVQLKIPHVTEAGEEVQKTVTITLAEFQKLQERTTEIANKVKVNNPFSALLEAIKEIDNNEADPLDTIKNIEDKFKAATKQVLVWGDSLRGVLGDDFSNDMQEAIEVLNGVMDVGSGVAKIIAGDMVGGITSLISGAVTLVSKLFPDIREQQAKMAQVEANIARAARDRNLEYVKGRNLIRDMVTDAELLNKLTERGFVGKDKLTDFQSKRREFEQLQKDLAAELANVEHARKQLGITDDEYLNNMLRNTLGIGASREDVEWLAQNDRLGKSGKIWYDMLVKAEQKTRDLTKRTEELGNSLYDSVMGTSFENFNAAAGQAIASAKGNVEELGQFTEETLRTSLLNGFTNRQLAFKLQPLFRDLAKAMLSGGSHSKVKKLRKQIDETLKQSKQEFEEMLKAYGIDPNKGTEQRGRAGGITTITQEQGTKLEGLFTAGQVHWSNIDKNIDKISVVLGTAIDMLKSIDVNTKVSSEQLKKILGVFEYLKVNGIKVK